MQMMLLKFDRGSDLLIIAALLGLESVSTGKLTDLRRHKTAWALLVIYIDLHESLMN